MKVRKEPERNRRRVVTAWCAAAAAAGLCVGPIRDQSGRQPGSEMGSASSSGQTDSALQVKHSNSNRLYSQVFR